MAKVQQEWDKERAAQEAAYAQAQAEARTKEQELQANADAIRQEKDREIRNLNALPNTTTNGSIATGCTGKELYRPDGEFLAREAARADELRFLLKQCRDQYEALTK
jgi:hypothetical protein